MVGAYTHDVNLEPGSYNPDTGLYTGPPRMYIGNYNGPERAYIKFDLSGQLPSGVINRADLYLYCFSVGASGGDNVEIHALRDDSWTQDTLTWDIAQASYLPEEMVAGPIYVGVGGGSGGQGGGVGAGWYHWDVTSYVREQILGDNVVSFVGISPTENSSSPSLSVNMSDKESSTTQFSPILRVMQEPFVVDVSVLPEDQTQSSMTEGTLTYHITVQNIGTLSDTYDLAVVDDHDWGPTLSTISLSLGSNEIASATVSVTLPLSARYYDKMTITATSRADPTKSDSEDLWAVAGLLPTDDSYVVENSNSANTNYGARGSFYVGNQSIGQYLTERSYLKFDLSTISIASDTGVKLCLYPFGSGGDLQCRKVENNAWSEAVITWNNQPHPNGGTDVLGTLNIGAGSSWLEFDVTDWVRSHLGTAVSFGLRADLENQDPGWSCPFDSSEAAGFYADKRPYLRFVPTYMVGVYVPPYQEYQENASGGQLTYRISVSNYGSESDFYHVYCSGDQGWTLELSEDQTGTIAPDGSENVYLTVTIPDGATPGTLDSITVTAASHANPIVTDDVQVVANAFLGIKPEPIADAYVHENFPTTNYGGISEINLHVGRKFDYRENAYLKFDISGVSSDATIRKVELWMWCWGTYPYSGTDLHLETCRVDDDDWTETGVTWDSHPEIGSVLADAHVTAYNKWYTWDVTDFVLNQLANDPYKLVSLCVRPRADCLPSREALFDSKEYGFSDEWPRLKIFYSPPSGVDVSISPTSKSGMPENILTYTVTVKNMGGDSDTYSLTIDDNASWSPTLSPTSLTVLGGENQTATLSVTVPANALEGDKDNITVTATSTVDSTVKDNASCIAHAILGSHPGVQVSISPSSQDGSSDGTLTYTVTVTNTGNITDTYTLENADTAGWTLTLPSSVTDVVPDEGRQVTLTVRIPATAADGDSATITVTATSSENTAVEDSDTCVANCFATHGIGVQVTISGASSKSGAPGGTLNFDVNVTNTGTGTDTFTLTVTDTKGWSSISPTSLSLAALASGTATLSVTIPSTAVDGTSTTITVTATSQANSAINGNATCTATATTGGVSPVVYVGAAVVIVAVLGAVLVFIRKPF
jgi:uncharacterized membrane protein